MFTNSNISSNRGEMKLSHDPKLPENNNSRKDMIGHLQGGNLLPGEYLCCPVYSWERDSVILMSLFQLGKFYFHDKQSIIHKAGCRKGIGDFQHYSQKA